MIHETRPLPASLFGLVAVVCAVFAWKRTDWSDLTRLLLAGVALIYGVIFLAWLVELFSYLLTRTLANAYAAKHSPLIRQLELIRSMSELQLAAVGQGLVRVTKIPGNTGLITQYRAPGMLIDLDRETVLRLTEACIDWPKWPELIPQHGMPGNRERDELRAFTQMVVVLGLAEQPRGNLPARWVVPAEKVWRGLEL